MPETAVTVNEVSETPVDLTTGTDGDETNGNSFSNPNGDLVLYFRNDDGGGNSATATVTAQTTSRDFGGYGPMTKSDLDVSLDDGDSKLVGPFSKQAWNDANDNVIVNYTGTGAAGVKVVPLKLKKF